jgi:hypothetical protein
LDVICEAQEELFGFEKYGEYEGQVLMLVGKKSFQYEIENNRSFFLPVFPNIKEKDIVHVEDAGHWLHYEKQEVTISNVVRYLKEIS